MSRLEVGNCAQNVRFFAQEASVVTHESPPYRPQEETSKEVRLLFLISKQLADIATILENLKED